MTYRVGLDAANSNNRRISSDNDRHVAKVYGYNQDEVEAKAEMIVDALNMQIVKPMDTAPRDRAFLATFTPEMRGGTVFCRFRPERFRNGLDLEQPNMPRWDAGGQAVFFEDKHFVGWTDLPVNFRDVDQFFRDDERGR